MTPSPIMELRETLLGNFELTLSREQAMVTAPVFEKALAGTLGGRSFGAAFYKGLMSDPEATQMTFKVPAYVLPRISEVASRRRNTITENLHILLDAGEPQDSELVTYALERLDHLVMVESAIVTYYVYD